MQHVIHAIGFLTTFVSFFGFSAPFVYGDYPLAKYYDVLVLGLEPFPYSITLSIAGFFTGLILIVLADISSALRGQRSLWDLSDLK